ncbi:hypothetical protein [Pseudonocardia sp. McavD-2-B]|uniref:hypothetical protein n=1 Tax=Pseudonocardia sp. McavD-2-B TaxID=2954499 RepID=UPI0020984431|nr:hypothetical protein [Pseudonocardia sp. McavD-2-B]MCO7193958.1 hypothetical protein [Pseudonocardia sp. McavD-2-B]
MTPRVADAAGALWPRTARRCRACGMPSMLGDVHPSCAALPAAQPGPDSAIATARSLLGAEVLNSRTGTWLASQAPAVNLRAVDGRDPTTCADCGTPLSPRAAATGVVRHLACWQNSGAPR